jgi:predicted RNase H-like HicB family nuclease
MQDVRFIYWQDGDAWLGYLEEFLDYMTQGETLKDLEDCRTPGRFTRFVNG